MGPTLTHVQQLALAVRAREHVLNAIRLSSPASNHEGLQKQGRERTSAAAIDRLAARLAEPLPRDTKAARAQQAARAELRQAERLWWELALSAEYIAFSEADKRGTHCPMGYADRVQEGRIGLYHAARLYEPRANGRGETIRFATHARWWARARICRAVDESGGLLALSAHAAYLVRNYNKLPPQVAASITAAARELSAQPDTLAAALSSLSVVSIETPMPSTDGEKALGDMLPGDLSHEDVEATLDTRRSVAALREALSLLSRLAANEHRAATRCMRDETHADTGRALGVTRERARQLEGDGFASLARLIRAASAGPQAVAVVARSIRRHHDTYPARTDRRLASVGAK